MPIIMDPEHKLAVDSYLRGVKNLNLYFFSWAAFLVSFLNFVSCACNTINTLWPTNGATTTTTTTTTDTSTAKNNDHRCCRSLWAGCVVMSFVVMIASCRIYNEANCSDDDLNLVENFDAFCGRTKYGISLGVISAIDSLIWMLTSKFWVKGSSGTIVEFVYVSFLTAMWTVGVILLTFDEKRSPGYELGNLYFFTWGGWSLFIFLCMPSFNHLMSRNKVTDKSDCEKNKPAMEQVNEEQEFGAEETMDA